MEAYLQQFNWLDWGILVVLAVGLISGFLRGLVGMVAGLVAYLIGLVLAGRYSGAVLAWLDARLQVVDRLAVFLAREVSLPGGIGDLPVAAVPPEQLTRAIYALPLPAAYHAALLERLQQAVAAQSQATLAEVLFSLVAQGILAAVVFLLILAVVGGLLSWLARRLTDLADMVPLVGPINRWTGALAGLLEALLGLTLAVALVTPVLSMPFARPLALAVADSPLAGWLMNLYGWLAALIFGGAGRYFLSL